MRIAGAVWGFWLLNHLSEGRQQLERMIALSAPSDLPSTQAALSQGAAQSHAAFKAKALNGAGMIALWQGDYTGARSLHEETLTMMRELGDKKGIAYALTNLGFAAWGQGKHTTARSLHEESLAIMRELGDMPGIASSLTNLGCVVYSLGEYATSRLLHEESLTICRELGGEWCIANGLNNLGNVHHSLGEYDISRTLYKESLLIRRELGDRRGIAACLVGLARSAVGTGQGQPQSKRGARLLGAAEALLEEIGAALDADDRVPYEQGVVSARTQLGELEFEKTRQEGRAMSVEEAVAYALEEAPDG